MIKTDRGTMAPLIIAAAIIAMIFLALVWEWGRFTTIGNQVDKDVKACVQGIVTEQWDVVYQGMREGYAGAYTKKNDDLWKEIIKKKQISDQMAEMMKYTKDENVLSKLDSQGKLIYSITLDNVDVNVANTKKGDEEGKALTVSTQVTITIPWTFLNGLNGNIPPVVITKTVKGGFTPKF